MFVDIGANVGAYSIYAAVKRNVRVFCFEPEAQSYALLNKNILVNNLENRVIAYNIGLLNSPQYTRIFLSQFGAGNSGHSVGDCVDFNLDTRDQGHSQGIYSTTVDILVKDQVFPVPNHIKIDVDGFEHKVIEGAIKTLENPTLQSVLVEIYTELEKHLEIIKLMEDLGFYYDSEQVKKSQSQQGWNKGMGNYIFRRKH